MAQVYCGTCGSTLSEAAKFCRSCGSAQAAPAANLGDPHPPLPPPPPPPYAGVGTAPVQASRSSAELVAAILAVLGGAAMCVVTLFAVVYQPLHYDDAINYGAAVRLGDVVALLSGAAAIAIGALLWSRRLGGGTATGVWLVAAGTPTLVMALLWSFADTFNLIYYPPQFYFAYVYFADIGIAHIGERYFVLPLVLGCAMVVAAGFAVVWPALNRRAPGGPR